MLLSKVKHSLHIYLETYEGTMFASSLQVPT